MKHTILLAAMAIVASAYTVEQTENVNNDLADAHLKGKVKSITTTCYAVEGTTETFSGKTTFDFDVNGNEVADNNYDANFPKVYHKYKYNAQGYATEKQQYGPSITKGWKTLFTYDAQGRVTETNRYADGDPLMQRVVYKYDNEGKNTEQVSYAGNGQQNGRTVLKYNAGGAVAEQSEFSTFYGSMSLMHHSTYNTNGSSASETYGADHKVERSSRTVQTASDDHGNCTAWREDVKSHGTHYSNVYKREITYYQ